MADMDTWRRVGRFVLKVVLPLVVAGWVGWYFYDILRKPDLWQRDFALRFEWLIPAAVLYLLAHSLWGAYWTTLLRSQGLRVTFPQGVRSYFVSQFGKYVPGKVWVIVIRVAMLGKTGADKAIVGVTATFETLTSMAAGALLGVALLPLLAAEQSGGGKAWWLIPVAALPVGLVLLNGLIVRIAAKRRGPDAQPLPRVSMGLILRGLVQTSLGWLLLGLSLWMVIEGIQPGALPLTGEQYLRLVAVNCLGYVFGFLAFFMPGGAGAREFLLAKILAFEFVATMGTEVAEGIAVVVALVLRLVWTIAELIFAFMLYKFVSPPDGSLTPQDERQPA
jgi:glycosyltransferase 2 family protein